MTTGDLKGSLRKLEQSLRSLNYPEDIDYNGLAKGDPAAFLPIISYAFISYSTYVTEQLLTAGVELAGKNDSRFLDAVYKLLRNQFQYKPLLLKDQFLHYGFAERKMQLSCDIINIVTKRHKELSSLNKVKAQPYKNSSCPVKIHTRFKCESLIPDSLPSESNITIKPLVERHLSSNDVKTIHISSNPENEVVEDKPVREYSELPSSHENDIASDSIGGNEEYTLCQMTSRNSSDKEMRVETPESLSHQSSGYNSLLSADESPKAANINSLCLTEVTKTEAMKHKVERISKMIEETTELLKCTESSADNNAPSPLLSQKQSTTDA
ncbi:centrosomal protein of 44 kDa isoform X2 [Carcharodon carcharias]|uniref:centrosomal protein of 44 kDa isoform X2 n=1 Tax=Carcharodon carcharias TaxID=13397 RepID=UPI001B7F47CA|nr:centrosomal protein of 44 kDa isoform X2 [Carcharodon carcharias]